MAPPQSCPTRMHRSRPRASDIYNEKKHFNHNQRFVVLGRETNTFNEIFNVGGQLIFGIFPDSSRLLGVIIATVVRSDAPVEK